MEQIKEEGDNQSDDSFDKKDRLNMAALYEEHKQFIDKIAESQKKVLEEGLLRNHKKSKLFQANDLMQARKSIASIDLLLSQQPHGASRIKENSGNSAFHMTQQTQLNKKPDMNYFKHI